MNTILIPIMIALVGALGSIAPGEFSTEQQLSEKDLIAWTQLLEGEVFPDAENEVIIMQMFPVVEAELAKPDILPQTEEIIVEDILPIVKTYQPGFEEVVPPSEDPDNIHPVSPSSGPPQIPPAIPTIVLGGQKLPLKPSATLDYDGPRAFGPVWDWQLNVRFWVSRGKVQFTVYEGLTKAGPWQARTSYTVSATRKEDARKVTVNPLPPNIVSYWVIKVTALENNSRFKILDDVKVR